MSIARALVLRPAPVAVGWIARLRGLLWRVSLVVFTRFQVVAETEGRVEG